MKRPIVRDISLTKEYLREFERTVSDEFEKGKIRGPVHLSHGNEDYLIELFGHVHPSDWVFSTWRNHYHALLHGVPPDALMDRIMQSKSISFQSPEHHFYTSAIVGGAIPIATGAALGLKWSKSDRMVWCFVGDMAGESGTFYEAVKYSMRNELPIHFVIEDNQLSTNTPTQEAWGGANNEFYNYRTIFRQAVESGYVSLFEYTRSTYPHVGIGKWIHF